jgi:predicted outer membrane protein
MYKQTSFLRGASALCTVALLSLGTTGCMMGGMGAMSPEMMQAHSAMAHFTMAVHMSEIEDAQMAMSKSSNAQVREFAQRMVTEHTAAMQREKQMMMSMGMEMGTAAGMNMDMARMRAILMENPHSRPVMEAHMQNMQRMQGMSGMAFDRAYMQNQVAMHRYALEGMDRMMPSMGMTPDGAAASGTMEAGMHGGGNDMMSMMKNQRAMIASHLQMAQQMMGSMGSR